jgi:hypothetical protein
MRNSSCGTNKHVLINTNILTERTSIDSDYNNEGNRNENENINNKSIPLSPLARSTKSSKSSKIHKLRSSFDIEDEDDGHFEYY